MQGNEYGIALWSCTLESRGSTPPVLPAQRGDQVARAFQVGWLRPARRVEEELEVRVPSTLR